MIEKIDIKNFGMYKNFEWKKNVGNDENSVFKNLNIIYGRNYSGKTTLSRIFQTIEDGQLHKDFTDSEFSIYLKNGTVVNQDHLNQLNQELKVRVYNTEFVRRNLSWFYYEDGSIKPFALIGEKNIENEKKLEELKNKLGSIELRSGLLYSYQQEKHNYEDKEKNVEDMEKQIDNQLRKKAQEIKNKSDIYNYPTYNITRIKNDIERVINNPSSFLLNNEEINRRLKIIKESPKSKVNLIREFNYDYKQILSQVEELLKRKIKPSEPIQELLNDSLLQEWVREGIDKHKGKRKRCAFCNNYISDELWDRLDSHFNKESENLRVEIKKYINILEKQVEELSTMVTIDKRDFYSSFQSDLENILDDWANLKSRYINNIQVLIKELVEREKNIFKSREIRIENIIINKDINSFVKEINYIIELNNSQTQRLSEYQNNARHELRLSEVANFILNIDYEKQIKKINSLKNNLEKELKNLDLLENEIKKCNQDLENLKQQNDESKGADLINKYLEEYFGHDELRLAPEKVEGNSKFIIYREGAEAKNLSEGECSLISFCYFLAKIEDDLKNDSSKNNTIIYIDDPISSLDSNHIFFIFSLIENLIAKRKNYLQLFISTHNLDFLKYLKRLTIPNGNDSINYFLIERRKKQISSASFIMRMPSHIRNFVTEFNYLFNEIYSVYKDVRGNRKKMIENTYNQFYNLPNNIRKFLECYLFYKYPNNDHPLNNLDKFFDGNTPTLVNRIINEYSHLVYIDRGWKPFDVEEMELCVKMLVDKIKEKDSEQFKALLESIGVNYVEDEIIERV